MAALAAVGGCQDQATGLMPLSKKAVWTYSVQGDFDTYVATLKAADRVPVGPAEGWKLDGTMGPSRLGWAGGTLYASELAGQGFEPPLPLYSPSPVRWKGRWSMGNRSAELEATVESKKVKEQVAGRSTDAVMSVVQLKGRGFSSRLTTWFVPGIGVYRQEQRTGDRRTVRLDYLSGP
ncbi:MAG: hypothetical protein JST30_02255 [Armatimonadetes bacterium]|nr:hypothetical protein [Armatimonadota bacterium]